MGTDELADTVRQFVDDMAAAEAEYLESKIPQLEAVIERIQAQITWLTERISYYMQKSQNIQNMIEAWQSCHWLLKNNGADEALETILLQEVSVNSGLYELIRNSHSNPDEKLLVIGDFILQNQKLIERHQWFVRNHSSMLEKNAASLKIQEATLAETKACVQFFRARRGSRIGRTVQAPPPLTGDSLRKRKSSLLQAVPSDDDNNPSEGGRRQRTRASK